MTEKGSPRTDARVTRRTGPRPEVEVAPQPLSGEVDLGSLLAGAPDPEPPAPTLRKGDRVEGPVTRVAADAVFIQLEGALVGVLPVEPYKDGGVVRVKVGDALAGTVRVSPGRATNVLLAPADPAEIVPVADATGQVRAPEDASAAAPAPMEADPAPAPEIAAPAPASEPQAPPRRPAAKVVAAPAPEVEEDFATLLADHLDDSVRITEGAEVSGQVVKVTDDAIFVNLGAKTEGVLDPGEYKDDDGKLHLKVGDTVRAWVVSTFGDDGGIRLSRTLGAGPNPMDAVEEALNLGIPVEGRVAGRNKGGFEIKIGAVRGFVPLSQIDIHRVDEARLDDFIGQTLRFKVLRIKGREVVLSRADLIRAEAAEKVERLKKELHEGMTVTGRVRSVRDFGAFIELAPGLDGLLHVSEMSWGRVGNPREVLEEGQEVTVHVLKYDRATERLSLGLKQLGRDPWDTVRADYAEGQVVMGRVQRLTAFGAFIEIADGVDGLLHISNMSWERRIQKPADVVKVGDQVQVQILSIDPASRRISLGLKQLVGDPWAGVDERFPVGAQVEGAVEKVETFGVFVQLEPGVTALIPMSELGLEHGADAKRAFPPGTRVKAAVLDVDPERRRLSLSRKALDGASERQDFQHYQQKTKEAAPAEAAKSFGTLADVFKTKLGGLKR